jgi:hypothetical protein
MGWRSVAKPVRGTTLLIFAILLAAMLIGGRMIRKAAARARAEATKEAASLTHYRVRIGTPGGVKPKRKDVTQRYAIENDLERQKAGLIVDSSLGADFVELVVAVRDAEQGLEAIRATVNAAGVGDRSSITAVPSESSSRS